jgi:Spy/CpxP family protein refolding chaperone
MRVVPIAALFAGILVIPAAGAGQRANGAGAATAQGMGRGSTQTPPPAGSQGQPGPRPTPNAEQFLVGSEWWKDPTIKTALKLTDSQVRSISQIFERRVREVTPVYLEYRKQKDELDKMTAERTADEATYAVQVSRVQNLQSKLNETRTVMLYTIYRRLDPGQYQKLREIWDQRFRRGGGPPSPRSW